MANQSIYVHSSIFIDKLRKSGLPLPISTLKIKKNTYDYIICASCLTKANEIQIIEINMKTISQTWNRVVTMI